MARLVAFFSALARVLLLFGMLLGVWVLASASGVPAFILPGPLQVARALWLEGPYLFGHFGITLTEIILGFLLGTSAGASFALLMAACRPIAQFLRPTLVISQAIPVFALAPILVLWFGFGMAPKIVMAALIIFFPVTTSFYDGLARVRPALLDLALTMRASTYGTFVHVAIPAALPSLASGLRVAAAVAPIGAVVGEWVGSAGGLGFVMLNANSRARPDLAFAALALLCALSVMLWACIDLITRKLVNWQ